MARQSEVLKIAEAEANLRKAQLKVDVPTDLAGSLELRKAQIDADAAAKELAHQKSHAELAQRADAAELAALGELLHLAEQRVSELEDYIDRMKVRAPRDGIIIYYVNPWQPDEEEGRRQRRQGRQGARDRRPVDHDRARRGGRGRLEPYARSASASPCASTPTRTPSSGGTSSRSARSCSAPRARTRSR